MVNLCRSVSKNVITAMYSNSMSNPLAYIGIQRKLFYKKKNGEIPTSSGLLTPLEPKKYLPTLNRK